MLKFLPKFFRNSTNSNVIGKEGRLCSPRFLFYFERCMHEYSDLGQLQKLEFEIEDSIYKMLRKEFVITNNSANSLFSIPRNKKFVCINTDMHLRRDPITDSVNSLATYVDQRKRLGPGEVAANHCDSDSEDEIRPFKGFAKPLSRYKCRTNESTFETEKTNRLLALVKEHVDEAMNRGFDDSIAKYKGKGQFVVPSLMSWYETFKFLHRILIENPNSATFEANDPDYVSVIVHRV